jgi:hypothetical protein
MEEIEVRENDRESVDERKKRLSVSRHWKSGNSGKIRLEPF